MAFRLVFILLLVATAFTASGFMVLECAHFYARFYPGANGLPFGFLAALLNEAFLVIMAAVWLPAKKLGRFSVLHPGNLWVKLLMLFLFANTVGGASYNLVGDKLSDIQEQANIEQLLKLREAQVRNAQQKLETFTAQKQRVNTAIAAKELEKAQEELARLNAAKKSVLALWSDILLLSFLRFTIQLSNVTAIWLASWLYRQPKSIHFLAHRANEVPTPTYVQPAAINTQQEVTTMVAFAAAESEPKPVTTHLPPEAKLAEQVQMVPPFFETELEEDLTKTSPTEVEPELTNQPPEEGGVATENEQAAQSTTHQPSEEFIPLKHLELKLREKVEVEALSPHIGGPRSIANKTPPVKAVGDSAKKSFHAQETEWKDSDGLLQPKAIEAQSPVQAGHQPSPKMPEQPQPLSDKALEVQGEALKGVVQSYLANMPKDYQLTEYLNLFSTTEEELTNWLAERAWTKARVDALAKLKRAMENQTADTQTLADELKEELQKYINIALKNNNYRTIVDRFFKSERQLKEWQNKEDWSPKEVKELEKRVKAMRELSEQGA